MWLSPRASYSLVGSEANRTCEFLAFYSHFWVTQLNDVTSGHLRSCDVFSCHVTASSCELQPSRRWNIQYTRVFGFLKALLGDFLWNDDTSGSLPDTWGHLTSFPVSWLPPAANYSLVGSETNSTRKFLAFHSHFQVTSGQMTWLPSHFQSPEVTWRHFLSRDASSFEPQPCRKWNAQYTRVISLLQPLQGDFRSNDVTSGSLTITWGHVTSFPFTWLPPPASHSLVGSETHSICELSAFYSHFQVTSGQMTSLPGHLRSPEVTWRNFVCRDCLLLRATAL